MHDWERTRQVGVGEYLHLSAHHAEPPTWEEVDALRAALRDRDLRIAQLQRRLEELSRRFPGLSRV